MGYVDGFDVVKQREALRAVCSDNECDHTAISLVNGALLCGTHAWVARWGHLTD